jgi:hypothetical protein
MQRRRAKEKATKIASESSLPPHSLPDASAGFFFAF